MASLENSNNSQSTIRETALRQLERKRRFRAHLVFTLVLIPLLAVVWATTEYQNAGGWPTALRTGRRNHDWDPWIVYPLIVSAVALTVHAVLTYGSGPITEADVEREAERLRDPR